MICNQQPASEVRARRRGGRLVLVLLNWSSNWTSVIVQNSIINSANRILAVEPRRNGIQTSKTWKTYTVETYSRGVWRVLYKDSKRHCCVAVDCTWWHIVAGELAYTVWYVQMNARKDRFDAKIAVVWRTSTASVSVKMFQTCDQFGSCVEIVLSAENRSTSVPST